MDLIKLALVNIWRRKFRNGFTIIGVAVGISAIVAMLSLGEGMQQSIENDLGPLAADITLSPKSEGQEERRGPPGPGGGGGITASVELEENLLSDLNRIKNIDVIAPRVTGSATIKVANKEYNIQVMGIDPEAEKKLDSFSEFTEGELFSSRDKNAVLIGSRLIENLFKYRKPHVRSTIDLDGVTFSVAGILGETVGGGPGTPSYERYIVMNIEDAQKLLDMDDTFSSITVRANSVDNAESVAEDIEKKLTDVSASTMSSMMQSIQDVFSSISLFLTGIGGISLFVAAITILNNMYTAVMERRREIGTMKALGMNSNQVMMSFSLEAIILGVIGGLIGLGLAYIMTQAFGSFSLGRGPSMAPVFDMTIVIGSQIFAIVIALMSGMYPSYKAAQLSPVEALSYE